MVFKEQSNDYLTLTQLVLFELRIVTTLPEMMPLQN